MKNASVDLLGNPASSFRIPAAITYHQPLMRMFPRAWKKLGETGGNWGQTGRFPFFLTGNWGTFRLSPVFPLGDGPAARLWARGAGRDVGAPFQPEAIATPRSQLSGTQVSALAVCQGQLER
jgi:hypothetical protein